MTKKPSSDGFPGQQPLVTIVTPSLNAVKFIRETIESVLSQDYPNIEYIVMDGGSTDGTGAVIEEYCERLHYVREPDSGTADAINRGFSKSRGEILAWISADDTYLAGAVTAAVSCFRSRPDVAVVYGEGHWTDEQGAILGAYPTHVPYDSAMFRRECCLCQPTCFIRRNAFREVGMLDARLQSAFDYDLWIRLSRLSPFCEVRQYLATSRMHRRNKSLRGRRLMFQESIGLLRRYYGYVPVSWVYGYLSFLRDGRDQFFEPLRPSPSNYLASLLVGSCYSYRHLTKYWAEWAAGLTSAVSRFVSG